MSDFDPTDERLGRIASRMPGFPLETMRLVRLTFHLQKGLRDRTNAMLKKYDLVDASHTVLAILYGSPDETSSASRLSKECHEKPANLTRVCDELAARGLVARKPAPGDRRGVMISLTEAGRALIEEVLPAVCAQVSAPYAVFTDAELRQLVDAGTKVLRGMNSE